jgi:hypothetical protein
MLSNTLRDRTSFAAIACVTVKFTVGFEPLVALAKVDLPQPPCPGDEAKQSLRSLAKQARDKKWRYLDWTK